jgi:hypothetical protein
MTPVGVPKSNTKVWKLSRFRDGTVLLTKEAEQWLETNVGIRQFRHLDQPEYRPPRDHWLILNTRHSISPGQPTKIYFKNPDHAMLFKLTFL